MEPDFSGYVTKYNLKCADGRTIAHAAFSTQDGTKVPLVYQHNHTDLNQVLGHVILSKRDDGIWGDAYLNDSSTAQAAKVAVDHGDLDKFSIWAKDLQERGYMVHDGVIQEASLVLAGSNPGANIYNVLKHGNIDEDENLMIVGFELQHADTEPPAEPKPDDAPPANEPPAEPKPDDAPPADGDKTVADVLSTLTDDQQTAVNSVIDGIVKEAVTQALTEEPAVTHSAIDSSKEGSRMTRNIFDQSKVTPELPQLKHGDVTAVLDKAKANGGTNSLRELVRSSTGQELMHADTYGIDNIEVLFPDAQALMQRPTFVDRRQDWVKSFMAGTSKSPFSRVKTLYADITADEARAKGYIKANQKVEEVFPVFKRTTGPAMVYKKQKLDRQDIIDIVDFDVVAWMKVEMRGKLDEELARAALFGDGRAVDDPDKIQEPTGTSGDGIRSILNDHDLYTTTYNVALDTNATGSAWNVLLDSVTEAREYYMGSGNLTAFVPYRTASRLLTIRDDFGHRIYRNLGEVAGDMDVNSIVRVPTELFPTDVLAVVLDLSDYNFGANRGGEVTLFEDFDIDFNQHKYLIETYLSGAQTLPYCSQIFMRVDPTDTLVEPQQPAIANNVITIPTQPGVEYTNADTGAVLADGSTVTLTEADPTVTIEARPEDNFYFADNRDQRDSWTYRYTA
jgi:HK97 family phage prohead protease